MEQTGMQNDHSTQKSSSGFPLLHYMVIWSYYLPVTVQYFMV
jgi:hypothetical protein